ncbi:MAG: hypothetical protein ABEJ56_05455 [Candidatus Nanohaloarchaea archaeon]
MSQSFSQSSTVGQSMMNESSPESLYRLIEEADLEDHSALDYTELDGEGYFKPIDVCRYLAEKVDSEELCPERLERHVDRGFREIVDVFRRTELYGEGTGPGMNRREAVKKLEDRYLMDLLDEKLEVVIEEVKHQDFGCRKAGLFQK